VGRVYAGSIDVNAELVQQGAVGLQEPERAPPSEWRAAESAGQDWGTANFGHSRWCGMGGLTMAKVIFAARTKQRGSIYRKFFVAFTAFRS
jgi:hypothetical protein